MEKFRSGPVRRAPPEILLAVAIGLAVFGFIAHSHGHTISGLQEEVKRLTAREAEEAQVARAVSLRLAAVESRDVAELSASLQQHHEPRRPVVAWAITLTADGPYIDGAAVLARSVMHAHSEVRRDGGF